MKEYEVAVKVSGYCTYIIEAENEEDAIEIAREKYSMTNLGSLEYANGSMDHVTCEGKIHYLEQCDV